MAIHIGDIKGDFFSSITIEDATVHYVDSQYTYLLAEFPRISTQYSLANLWHSNYILN